MFTKRNKGFTLVEIMIVVAIIALLAAIAIPNLLRTRIQANEAAAIASLKTIATAEISYNSANATYVILATLDDPTPPYIDSTLAAGAKNGYTFATTDIAANTFHCSGVPTVAGVSGVRSFCVTEDGVVKVQPAGGAIASRAACLLLNPA